jgi:uncharacterized membrane protein
MINVILYTRPNCTPCEQAKADLESLQAQIPHSLTVVDITTNPDLLRAYAEKVPVIETGPYRAEAPFDRQKLMMILGASRDRHTALEESPDYQKRRKRAAQVQSGDKLSAWVSHHYVWLIGIMLALYVGLPFLAPTLMKVGAPGAANVIYTVYSPLCHELGFRSFYLYGEQPFYPRETAGVSGVRTFGQATGLDEYDLLAARAHVGDEILGYKVALCQRDVALYLSMLGFVIIFGITGKRIKPLHWALWIVLGMGPIGLDGFSQLFSQIPGLDAYIPYRESTPFLRVFTGALFGFTTAWFGIPYVEESMRETREILARKFATISARQTGE